VFEIEGVIALGRSRVVSGALERFCSETVDAESAVGWMGMPASSMVLGATHEQRKCVHDSTNFMRVDGGRMQGSEGPTRP
jgi:hypothetical protein